jgi:hypothetical protein
MNVLEAFLEFLILIRFIPLVIVRSHVQKSIFQHRLLESTPQKTGAAAGCRVSIRRDRLFWMILYACELVWGPLSACDE